MHDVLSELGASEENQRANERAHQKVESLVHGKKAILKYSLSILHKLYVLSHIWIGRLARLNVFY